MPEFYIARAFKPDKYEKNNITCNYIDFCSILQ